VASVFKRKGGKRWNIAWFDHEGNRRERASGTFRNPLTDSVGSRAISADIQSHPAGAADKRSQTPKRDQLWSSTHAPNL